MIKTLLKSVREYKLPSILCPIVMVGEAVMEIIIPFLILIITPFIVATIASFVLLI